MGMLRTGSVALLILVVGLRAEAADKAPRIVHQPVGVAIRGTPVHFTAQISPGDAPVTSTVVQIKSYELGPTWKLPMTPSDEGVRDATFPAVDFGGLGYFYYCIAAYDADGDAASSKWLKVKVINPADGSSAAAVEAPSKRKLWWWGGAAGAAVAAVLLLDDDGNGGDAPPPPPPGPAGPSGGGRSRDDDDDDDNDCETTGKEEVSYGNTTTDTPSPISILVCYTCPSADLKAVASWGEVARARNAPNDGCGRGNVVLFIEKPGDAPDPGSETIEVFSNGNLVGSRDWPDSP
jgi:hypothetical protein